jgi:hypothetical protein
MKTLFAMVLASLAFSVTAMASTCVPLSDLGDHNAKDDTTIEITTMHGKYLFATTGGCDFKFADGIGFKPFSSFEICTGDEMFTWDQQIGETGWCVIDSITKE